MGIKASLLTLDVPTRWNLTYIMLDYVFEICEYLVGWKRRMGITNFILVKRMEMGKKPTSPSSYFD